MRVLMLGAGALIGLNAAADAAERTVTPRAALIAAVGGYDAQGPIEAQPTARAELGVDARWLLDSGVTVGAALGAAAEIDNRRRGFLGGCAPGANGCALIAPITNVATDPNARSGRARAAIEDAYVFVEGPWGEASVGRDIGAAARFSLPPPDIVRGATLADPLIDPTGLGGIPLSADLTGYSAKVTAISPRWLGVKVGVSYAPEAKTDRLSRPVVRAVGRPFEGDDAIEAGASFSRTWANGVETTLGLGWSETEGGAAFGDVSALSLGAHIARGPVRLGVAALEGEVGTAPGREIRSLAVGGTYEAGAWRFAAGAGRLRDQWFGQTVETARIGARKRFGEAFSVALVAQTGDRTADSAVSAHKQRFSGATLEISLDL